MINIFENINLVIGTILGVVSSIITIYMFYSQFWREKITIVGFTPDLTLLKQTIGTIYLSNEGLKNIYILRIEMVIGNNWKLRIYDNIFQKSILKKIEPFKIIELEIQGFSKMFALSEIDPEEILEDINNQNFFLEIYTTNKKRKVYPYGYKKPKMSIFRNKNYKYQEITIYPNKNKNDDRLIIKNNFKYHILIIYNKTNELVEEWIVLNNRLILTKENKSRGIIPTSIDLENKSKVKTYVDSLLNPGYSILKIKECKL